ncbi:RNA-dependent RNA polymerase, partial [Russula dissimulans]
MPSKYAARIAQAFTATDPSVKIRRDQKNDIGSEKNIFTGGVGTISPQLADMIGYGRQSGNRVATIGKIASSRLHFYSGSSDAKELSLWNHRCEGIKMGLRPSQCKFPVHDVGEAEFEIAQCFDFPNPVHLNSTMGTLK